MYIIDNLDNKIKSIVKRKHTTLKELAISMELTEPGLYSILRRDNMPLDKFLAMANGLDIAPCELLSIITINTSANAINDDGEAFIPINDATIDELLKQVIKTNKIIETLLTKKHNN